MLENWKEVYRAAGVGAGDRVYFAFSFGPFIGFWLAFEAAQQLHCLCLPGGGLSSAGRLRALCENKATVLCCTPSYAIRLAEVARGRKNRSANQRRPPHHRGRRSGRKHPGGPPEAGSIVAGGAGF